MLFSQFIPLLLSPCPQVCSWHLTNKHTAKSEEKMRTKRKQTRKPKGSLSDPLKLERCSDGKQKSFMNSSLTSFIVFKYFFYVVLLATFFFKGFASENLQEMVTFSTANILILVARQGFTFMPSSPPTPTPGTLSDKTQTWMLLLFCLY